MAASPCRCSAAITAPTIWRGGLPRSLGGKAAITTAGDLRHGVALDEPPPGWRLGNPAAAKAIMAALLAGEAVALRNETPSSGLAFERAALGGGGRHGGSSSPRSAAVRRPSDLLLHPATLALGVGCERLAPADEVIALAEHSLAAAGLSPLSVACVASIALKAAEPAVHALAAHLGVPARFFAADSAGSARRRGWPTRPISSFARPAAMAWPRARRWPPSGRAGRLVLPKRRSARATCAIGIAPRIIDPETVGRPRGRLAIVGLGPGCGEGRTPEVGCGLARRRPIGSATSSISICWRRSPPARRSMPSSSGAEEARVAHALDLAAAGREVALISSGDAGIYAMATLVFELIERGGRPDWARVEITGLPGVSAMQVAAARIGAPLGHDFCAISLSDLLTPWPVIERRLRAAADGDFVVALYNPVSQRRRHQLAAARDILLKARPGRDAGGAGPQSRPAGESLRVTTLGGSSIRRRSTC